MATSILVSARKLGVLEVTALSPKCSQSDTDGLDLLAVEKSVLYWCIGALPVFNLTGATLKLLLAKPHFGFVLRRLVDSVLLPLWLAKPHFRCFMM